MTVLSFLHRFWRRPPSPLISHTLVCGASRSGKSSAELARLVPLARAGEHSIVLMDPPGTLARQLLLSLHELGLDHRAIYDRLADTDRMPGFDWLPASIHQDPLQREAENENRVREFAAVLLRRRGIQDAARTPLIEEGLLAALQLYLAQDAPVPLPWLADVFDGGSEAQRHLLAHCTEPRLLRKFQEYARLGPMARRTEIGPAERILRAVCLSPAFRVRSEGATFDFDRFLDEQGILLFDGSSRGNLSRDAAAVLMGSVILRVISHCRTGAGNRVVLVLDEAVNAGLIGLHESQALGEAGKWGLEFHILVQDPFSFGSDEIRSNVLQNTMRHEWFRQGSPEAARLAAEDIAIPILDPLKVHHTEHRIRMADAGFSHIETTSRGEHIDPHGERTSSVHWQTARWPHRKEVSEAQDRYTALTDQILLIQKELMLLKPGERLVRADKVTPTPEYVPMLHESAVRQDGSSSAEQLAEAKFREVLEKMKRRPMYRPPATGDLTSHTPRSQQGAARRLTEQGK